MWNTIAQGFSEFASVVQQDAQMVMQKVSEQTAQLAAVVGNDENDDDPLSSPQFKETSTSMSPARGVASASALSEKDAVGGRIVLPASSLDALTSLISQADVDKYTPRWLLAAAADEEGSNDDDAARKKKIVDVQKALDLGSMLLRNSESVLERFSEQFVGESSASGRDHSMESLEREFQALKVEKADTAGAVGVTAPSDFFIRYFTLLNRHVLLDGSSSFAPRGSNRNDFASSSATAVGASLSSSSSASSREQAVTILALETRVAALEQENMRLQTELRASLHREELLRAAVEAEGEKRTKAATQVLRLQQQLSTLQQQQQRDEGTTSSSVPVRKLDVAAVSMIINANNDSHQRHSSSASDMGGGGGSSGNNNNNNSRSPTAAAVESSSASSAVKIDEEEEEEWADLS